MLYDTLPEITSQPMIYSTEETAQRQHARLERRMAERIQSLQDFLENCDPHDNGGYPWCAYLDGDAADPYDCPLPCCAEFQPFH